MDNSYIRNLRVKQFTFMNLLFVVGFVLFFSLVDSLELSNSDLQFVTAFLLLSSGLFQYSKRNRTNSIFPFVSRIQEYEKEKMGVEWSKQRKFSSIASLFIGIMMLVLAWTSNAELRQDDAASLDFSFLVILYLFLMIMVNVSLFIHNRRVDKSEDSIEFKGYAAKWSVFSIVAGIIFGVATFALIIAYVIMSS
ncbi:hypothetical protein [Thalassobacillus hwangdonensis]|uniref:ABC transporter permease n=1 Tax=Thalassobacillus hwangdonensis TaxID=546108 RepID=A0ABW3KY81_9BACI